MTTTIQISEQTKEKLFTLINKLEQNLKRRITYDEAIQFLLDNRKIIFDKESFVRTIEKYEGIFDKDEGKKFLREMRKTEGKRERRLKDSINSD